MVCPCLIICTSILSFKDQRILFADEGILLPVSVSFAGRLPLPRPAPPRAAPLALPPPPLPWETSLPVPAAPEAPPAIAAAAAPPGPAPAPPCYDCAWLSLTALSTVTCNLWL
jgi:hypothetical protein